jgi:FkbM family methyltransferase
MKIFKKVLYLIGAKARTKFILRVVKLLYFSPVISQRLSRPIERVFDPNNIRRSGNYKISTTWIEIVTTSGSKLELRLDEHIDWKTFLNGDWDSLCLNILTKLTEKLQYEFSFIDVGANFGAVCIPIAQKWPVLAFEPQPDLCQRLKSHGQNNRAEIIIVEELAITSQEIVAKSGGKLLIHSPDGNSGSASTDPNWNPSKGSRAREFFCSCVTLDDYFNNAAGSLLTGRQSLMKIDVEGEELHVLQGATKFLANSRPLVIFEFRQDLLGHKRSIQLNDFIASLRSYKMFGIKLNTNLTCIELEENTAMLRSFERLLIPNELVRDVIKALGNEQIEPIVGNRDPKVILNFEE